MNFSEYIQECYRTFNSENLNQREQVSQLCMGLVGEAGEVCDYMKKVLYHGHFMSNDEFMSELGDVMWYFALLVDFFGFDFEKILEINVQKLKKRYPDGFSSIHSIEREV